MVDPFIAMLVHVQMRVEGLVVGFALGLLVHQQTLRA